MIQKLKNEVSKVIVGQEEMIEAIMVALLSQGHILLEGMPGLAKTTTVKTFARALGVEFARVQFTPDLIPSDILGAKIYNPKTTEFFTKKGPIFANLVLADEINRAPAKVQSALLEAMQERQVTIDAVSYPLPQPFVVMATQNPIEQEGTYRLPEAQLDRFMMKVVLDYGDKTEELEILSRSEQPTQELVEQVVTRQELEDATRKAQHVYADEAIKRYILDIVFATREHPDAMHGASPRGSIDLLRAAKARAYLHGRDFVKPSDVASLALPVLRHRVILTFEARAAGKDADEVVRQIIESVPMP